MASKVLLIYTGGTIGMVRSSSGTLVPMDFENIKSRLPELEMLDFEVETQTFSPPIDSSNMTPATWLNLVEIIENNYKSYDGFVVLHGTDTMAYTASALSFLFHNLSKPVVFTGSQLPMGTLRTDGKENLITALQIAADNQNGVATVPEVCIFFQSKLFRGNRTTKFNAENLTAFRSDNYPQLADVGIHIKYNYPYIRYAGTNGDFFASKNIDNNVALLKIFPGITRSVMHNILTAPDLHGVVLETFGSGNAPTFKWFLDEIKLAIARGIIVVNVTQCLGGGVEMDRYATGAELIDIGVFSGRDGTTEATLTKLMYLLGNYDRNEIERRLQKSLRGEISAR